MMRIRLINNNIMYWPKIGVFKTITNVNKIDLSTPGESDTKIRKYVFNCEPYTLYYIHNNYFWCSIFINFKSQG